jgi:uncharacterized membrane protein YhaH (DUF805 family)
MNLTDNAFVNMYVTVDDASSHFVTYAILILIFVVSAYIIIRQFNDTGKSLLYSSHITTILSLVLYYMGKVINYSFVPDVILLGLLVIESIAIAGIYYTRMD